MVGYGNYSSRSYSHNSSSRSNSTSGSVQITVAMVITCIIAASGGLIFGYDIGISGITNYSMLLLIILLSLIT